VLLKPGVDISRLNRWIRRFLDKADAVYVTYDEELVITSTYEGTHGPASLHYADDAVDLRLPKKHKREIFSDLRNIDPARYDVVDEGDHTHCEYDPH
jgi:hypothetical protein